MAEMVYQQRGKKSTRMGVSQQRSGGGRVLEDNRAVFKEAAQLKENNTGLPDNLKSGIESLSGMSMDHVKVHYNSSKPAQLSALAYAQGSDIHVAPGQEKHVPHEAWHVVQQAQGRVRPTMQMKDGVPVNDEQGLETEADVMGGKALSVGQMVEGGGDNKRVTVLNYSNNTNHNAPVQGAFVYRMLLGHIIEDQKPDTYYKKINFIAIPALDGRIIWCDPRNAEAVKTELEQEGDAIVLPEDAEQIQDVGVNVEQDGLREGNPEDQEYYYIGQGIAWTTRIRTCTALAIFDYVTGNSFLCHADGGEGNSGRIVQHLQQYLQRVPDQQYGSTLTVNVFTAEDTHRDKGGSFTDVIKSLEQMELRCDSITYVHPDDTVAVFAGGAAEHLRPTATLLLEAIESYCSSQSPELKQYILFNLDHKPGLIEKVEQELALCFRTLLYEGKDISYLEPYLPEEDVDYYKTQALARSEREYQPASQSASTSTFAGFEPLKKNWADYSDDDEL
jgi:hypothetical protein